VTLLSESIKAIQTGASGPQAGIRRNFNRKAGSVINGDSAPDGEVIIDASPQALHLAGFKGLWRMHIAFAACIICEHPAAAD
jgi:hypothetical protein